MVLSKNFESHNRLAPSAQSGSVFCRIGAVPDSAEGCGGLRENVYFVAK